MKEFCSYCIVFTFVVFININLDAANSYSEKNEIAEYTADPDTIPKDSIGQILVKDSVADFRKEKLIAAILAFPVPFGFTGLHRIYLGSDPWVPVVYLCTGGGGFGLIPLIDFICIVAADEETFRKYENNPKFFMWIE